MYLIIQLNHDEYNTGNGYKRVIDWNLKPVQRHKQMCKNCTLLLLGLSSCYFFYGEVNKSITLGPDALYIHTGVV